MFLGNCLWVGGFVLWRLINHDGPWDPVQGVAYSFWGALALLSAPGVRDPLRLLPILLMQFVYKSIWLLVIYLPARTDAAAGGLLPVMVGGVVVLSLTLPWKYVLATYLAGPNCQRRSRHQEPLATAR